MSKSNDTRRHFDDLAADYYRASYEEPRDRHAHNLALRREVCLALLPKVEGRVLDLGCGPGAMMVPLLERGHRVVATDLSLQMVVEAARRAAALGGTPLAFVADATTLPLAPKSMSAVVTTGVLEYLSDLGAALAEIARVLEPNGVFIGTMSLPRRFERFVVRSAAKLRGLPQPAQFIRTRSEFDLAVTRAGFRIDARQCCTFAPFPIDAVWPASVRIIDRRFGRWFNRSEVACDLAKTYVVRAVREC